MSILLILSAILMYTVSFFTGLFLLNRFACQFTDRPSIFMNGLDTVEISYLTIVLSTILCPVTIYHLLIVLKSGDRQTDEIDSMYWVAYGFLITLFHVITYRLMEKISKNGNNAFSH